MAVNLGSGVVTISANLAPLRTALVSARYQLSSFVAGTRSLTQVSGFLAGNFLVSGVISLGRAFAGAGQAAADMGETINKLKVVFGASNTDVRKFADELAADLGYAKGELLDAASAFGAMGRGSGMAAKEAAVFANEMVKLAVDMRSVENVPFTVAVQKLQSGLSGTTRPLRQYGILLSADMVKQEALRLGLIKVGQTLDEQAKVVARASLEFKKAQFAMNDAAITAESTSNLQVAATGRLVNAYTEFGKALMPLWHGLAKGLNNAAKWIEGFVENNKGAFYAFASRVADTIKFMNYSITEAFRAIQPSFQQFMRSFSYLWSSIAGNMDIIDAFRTAFVFGLTTARLATDLLLKSLNAVIQSLLYAIDYFFVMNALAAANPQKIAEFLGTIAGGGHILKPRGETFKHGPEAVPPPEENRAEGVFGGAEAAGEGKGKKGKVLTSLADFWEQLQGGVGDVQKQQLKAQQEGNAKLNQIVDELKKNRGNNNFGLAAGGL
jgi:hypothetical protein